MEEVSSYLSRDFVIWINPGEVTFTMGDKSQVKVLYTVGKPTVSATSSTPGIGTSCDNAITSSLPQQPPISLTSCPTAITSASSGKRYSIRWLTVDKLIFICFLEQSSDVVFFIKRFVYKPCHKFRFYDQ